MAFALSSALNTPFKTLERVGQILPRYGNGGNLVIIVMPRINGASYRNMDNTADQSMFDVLDNLSGWDTVTIRGTNQGSDSFTNTAADKIRCGFLRVSTTNAGGYNPIGGSTAITLTCQLAGGGAPGFPAEASGFSALSGKRIRFTSGAFLNTARMIWKNTTITLTLDRDLPGVPAITDTFVIEEPGVQVGDLSHITGVNDFFGMAGFTSLTSASIDNPSSTVEYAGLSSAANIRINGRAPLVSAFYTDETFGVIDVGVGFRCGAEFLALSCSYGITVKSSYCHDNATINNSGGQVLVGPGCFFRQGLVARYIGNQAEPNANGVGSSATIGNNAGATRPMRISFDAGARGLTGAITLSTSTTGVTVVSVDFAGQSVPLITSAFANVSIGTLSSVDGGNTDVVLDISSSNDCSYGIQTSVITASATLGDLRLAGGVIASFANLAFNNYPDINRNNVFGPAGTVSVGGVNLTNASGGTIAAFNLVRGTGTSGQMTPARGDTLENATGILGMLVTTTLNGAVGLVVPLGPVNGQFESINPVNGNTAYLSAAVGGLLVDGVAPTIAVSVGTIIRRNLAGSIRGIINLIPSPPPPVLDEITLLRVPFLFRGTYGLLNVDAFAAPATADWAAISESAVTPISNSFVVPSLSGVLGTIRPNRLLVVAGVDFNAAGTNTPNGIHLEVRNQFGNVVGSGTATGAINAGTGGVGSFTVIDTTVTDVDPNDRLALVCTVSGTVAPLSVEMTYQLILLYQRAAPRV